LNFLTIVKTIICG